MKTKLEKSTPTLNKNCCVCSIQGRIIPCNSLDSNWHVQTRKNLDRARFILNKNGRIIFSNLTSQSLFGNLNNKSLKDLIKLKNAIIPEYEIHISSFLEETVNYTIVDIFRCQLSSN